MQARGKMLNMSAPMSSIGATSNRISLFELSQRNNSRTPTGSSPVFSFTSPGPDDSPMKSKIFHALYEHGQNRDLAPPFVDMQEAELVNIHGDAEDADISLSDFMKTHLLLAYLAPMVRAGYRLLDDLLDESMPAAELEQLIETCEMRAVDARRFKRNLTSVKNESAAALTPASSEIVVFKKLEKDDPLVAPSAAVTEDASSQIQMEPE